MSLARWSLVAGLACGGCATTVHDQMSALEAAPVCCKSYSEMHYASLQVDKPQSVKLGPASPAFAFESGKSYFYAVRLPVYSGPLVLSVDSEGTVLGAERSFVLRPEVLMLDANFQVTRHIAGEDFKHTRASDFLGNVFINQSNAAETYIVIFTRTGAGETVKQFTPYTFSLGAAPITLDGGEQTVPLAFGPAGLLTLTLQRYQPARIKP
jgi:hypothetical protein